MTDNEKFAELLKIAEAWKKDHATSCPHCGACQHCGRGGYTPVYPIYPQPHYPYAPWYQPQITWTTGALPIPMGGTTSNGWSS